jgi:spermidine/putrescine ABC transporter ATP-binding subunit
MQAAEVRLENLGKKYGDLWAVREIHLTIGNGEFFTLLGPSGCGKTTLLRVIAGFLQPDEGGIFIDGQAMNRVPPWKRNLGMVFQNYALWPHLTVFENVAFGLRERKIPRREIELKVKNALELVNLKGTEARRPSQLSGGQQQRVALARTLVIEPRALLLDEPLSNLDAKLRQDMRLELVRLQRETGLTTIYVTHDQEEALALSSQIAVMHSGKIIQKGTPREIYDAPRHRFIAEFVGRSNLFSGAIVGAQDGLIEVETVEGYRLRARAPALFSLGETVTLNVRPEAIEVTDPDSAAPVSNRISGVVAASVYQGTTVEYEIEAGGRKITADLANPKRKRPFPPGSKVAVVFAAEDVGTIDDRA